MTPAQARRTIAAGGSRPQLVAYEAAVNFEEAPYTFKDAWYDCGSVNFYAGDDEGFQAALSRVLVRLPSKAREYALRRCTIFSIGEGAGGIVWPSRIVDRRKRRWVIVIDANTDDLESVIAHEIAHAWLGHDRLNPNIGRQVEVDAANLVRAWDFGGRGADPEHCAG